MLVFEQQVGFPPFVVFDHHGIFIRPAVIGVFNQIFGNRQGFSFGFRGTLPHQDTGIQRLCRIVVHTEIPIDNASVVLVCCQESLVHVRLVIAQGFTPCNGVYIQILDGFFDILFQIIQELFVSNLCRSIFIEIQRIRNSKCIQ